MPVQPSAIAPRPSALAVIVEGAAALSRWVSLLSAAMRAADEVERLLTAPDSELRRRGLRRSEVVADVFRRTFEV